MIQKYFHKVTVTFFLLSSVNFDCIVSGMSCIYHYNIKEQTFISPKYCLCLIYSTLAWLWQLPIFFREKELGTVRCFYFLEEIKQVIYYWCKCSLDIFMYVVDIKIVCLLVWVLVISVFQGIDLSKLNWKVWFFILFFL